MSFVNQRKDDLIRVHASEYRIEFLVRNGTIIGKIDMMFDSTEGIEIQYYKTSDEVIAPEAAAMQVKNLGLRTPPSWKKCIIRAGLHISIQGLIRYRSGRLLRG